MTSILSRPKTLRGWASLVLLSAAIVAIFIGFSMKLWWPAAKPGPKHDAESQIEEKVVTPTAAAVKKGDSKVPERLRGAARRLYSGFVMFKSEQELPWEVLKAGDQWSEKELDTLRAIRVMLEHFGDSAVVEALPGGKKAFIKEISPLNRTRRIRASRPAFTREVRSPPRPRRGITASTRLPGRHKLRFVGPARHLI